MRLFSALFIIGTIVSTTAFAENERSADAEKIAGCNTTVTDYNNSLGKVNNACKALFPTLNLSSKPDDKGTSGVETCIQDIRYCLNGEADLMLDPEGTDACQTYNKAKRATALFNQEEKLRERKKNSEDRVRDIQKEIATAQKEGLEQDQALQKQIADAQAQLQKEPVLAQQQLLNLGLSARKEINDLQRAINNQGQALRQLKELDYAKTLVAAKQGELAIAEECEKQAYDQAKAEKAAINEATRNGTNQVDRIERKTFATLFKEALAACKSRRGIKNKNIVNAQNKEINVRQVKVDLVKAADEIERLVEDMSRVQSQAKDQGALIQQQLLITVQNLQKTILLAQQQLFANQQRMQQQLQQLQQELQAARQTAREEADEYNKGKSELAALKRQGIQPETDKDYKEQLTNALNAVRDSNYSDALRDRYNECIKLLNSSPANPAASAAPTAAPASTGTGGSGGTR
jgi:hypothetical protein